MLNYRILHWNLSLETPSSNCRFGSLRASSLFGYFEREFFWTRAARGLGRGRASSPPAKNSGCDKRCKEIEVPLWRMWRIHTWIGIAKFFYRKCYGDLLSPIVMEKVPEEVWCIVLRSHDETPWSLADLRKQLRLVLEMREKNSLGQSDTEVSALLIPSFLQLVTCLVPWEEKTRRKTVCSVLFFSVMDPIPRTRVRTSKQLTRD